ncbi:MAG: SGNH/GDSL hydrolase family protein [Candidatus Brocadiaceae bacterium]|nr:SGNH/GDSL hydrolase family protein [Candidatus Brocadiaceae bacterium]
MRYKKLDVGKTRNLKIAILLSICGIAFTIGVGEGFARYYTSSNNFLLSHNPVIQKQTEGTDIFEPNKNYGHVLINNSFVGLKKLESLEETISRIANNDIIILNLGDSSTSGWNSELITENSEAKHKEYNSPFFSYPTYSDKLNEEQGVSAINAGVPGYSSNTCKRKVGALLEKLKQMKVYPNYVTIYLGNNDSVWNLNVKDKDLFICPFDSHLFAIVKERLNMLSSRFSTKPRVSIENYKVNLKQIVQTVQKYNAIPILIIPIIPKYWKPGLRTEGQENELDKWLHSKYDASHKLREATEYYNKGLKLFKSGNSVLAKEFFQEAQEKDYFVPRIKLEYIKKIKKIGKETGTKIISVQSEIPIDDRSFFIDYCHPNEKANQIIAKGIINIVEHTNFNPN